MANSVASESILLIAGIIVTTAFVGVFAGVVQNMSGGVEDRGSDVADELRTDITIINDPQEVDTSPLTLYVKNTGSRTLDPTFVSVLVDGEISSDLTLDVLGSTDDTAWRVGDVLQIEVNDLSVGAGDHRVRVVTESGVEAEMRFTA